jgi:hypothetical protein
MFRCWVPSARMVKTSKSPSGSLAKPAVRPSGDQFGWNFSASLKVSCRTFEPLGLIVKTSRSSSPSLTNTIVLPFGDQLG